MIQYNIQWFADETSIYERNVSDFIQAEQELNKARVHYNDKEDFDQVRIQVRYNESNNTHIIEETWIEI